MYRRVAIVTGLLAEADAFMRGEGKADNGVPFACRHGDGWSIACAGIGKVHAAMAAQHLVAQGCDLLVSLGVAGGLSVDGPGPFWLTHAIQHDYGAARPDGFVAFRGGVMPLGTPSDCAFAAIEDPGSGLAPARIVSGDAFVEDPSASRRLAETHEADLVDMESAAIAQVAAAHGLPFAGVRAVSDDANGDSAANFQDNLVHAANSAARALERLLPTLVDR